MERKIDSAEVRTRLLEFADNMCRDLEIALGIDTPDHLRGWPELMALVKRQTEQLIKIRKLVND